MCDRENIKLNDNIVVLDQIARQEETIRQLQAENERLKAELRDKQLLVSANQFRNYHLSEALQVAKTFLQVHNGTKKVLAQIDRIEKGESK